MSTSRPARVLHLLPDLACGGGQSVVLRSLAALDRSRFTPIVMALGPVDDLAAEFEAHDIAVVRTSRRDVVAAVRDVIRRRHIDIVHVHSDVDRRIGMRAVLRTGTPLVAHLHSMWVHLAPDPEASWLGARIRLAQERRAVRAYVAASDAVARDYAPFVRAPLAVLPAPVGPAFADARNDMTRHAIRKTLGIASSAPLAVGVGRFAPGKGQVEAIEAFAKAHAAVPESHLVLVGDGPEHAAAMARAAMFGVADAVHFVGMQTDPAPWVGAADVYLDASHSEAFGLAVLEALSAALPVVAYELPPFAEFVPPEASSLVPVGDVDALAESLRTMLSDLAMARARGEAGVAVAATHTPEAAAAVLAGVYSKIIAQSETCVA